MPAKGSVAIFEATPDRFNTETAYEIAMTMAKDGWEVDFFFLGELIPNVIHFKPDSVLQKILYAPQFGRLTGRWVHRKIMKICQDFSVKNNLSLSFFIPKRRFKSLWKRPIQRSKLESLEILQQFSLPKHPVGRSVASVLVSLTANSRVEPVQHRKLVNKLFISAQMTFELASRVLSQKKYDRVVVFNGRFPEAAAVACAARENSATVFFHERGGWKGNRYLLLPFPVHDEKERGKLAIQDWMLLGEDERHRRSAELHRAALEWQNQGGSPSHLSSVVFPFVPDSTSKKQQGVKVVFFTSSEDELGSIGRYLSESCFRNQEAGATTVAEICAEHGWSLTLRVHPHLRHKSQEDQNFWDLEFSSPHPGVRVVPSTSNLNSYDLVASADLVVVWSSTIGLEAVIRGKPTIALASTFYEYAGAQIFRPRNSKALRDFMESVEKNRWKPPKNYRESTLAALNQLAYGGKEFQFYDPAASTFLGRTVGPSRVWSFALRLAKYLKPRVDS